MARVRSSGMKLDWVVDGCLLVVCRWVAELYRRRRAGEGLKESDCSRARLSDTGVQTKKIPLQVVNIVALRRWLEKIRRKLGDGLKPAGGKVSSHARAGRQADDKLGSIAATPQSLNLLCCPPPR